MSLKPSMGKRLLGVVTFILIIGCTSPSGSMEYAPDFSLESLTGELISLSQFKGKIVLVDFWATWCPPCRQSIPELVKLQEQYREDGLIILGLSLDDPQQANNEYLRAFVKHFKINYPILRADLNVVKAYNGTVQMAIPTLFVVARDGKIAAQHVGFSPGAVEQSIKKLL